jgi:hypothetical protein
MSHGDQSKQDRLVNKFIKLLDLSNEPSRKKRRKMEDDRDSPERKIVIKENIFDRDDIRKLPFEMD